MVGVDANTVQLEMKGELATLGGAKFLMILKVGPTPQTTVDDVG
jgi:hypothetical protein